jgi:amidase
MLAGREPSEEDVEPLTWTLYEHARELDTITRMASQAKLEGAARAIVGALAQYDAVVTPALARRPLRIGEVHGRGPDPWDHFQRSGYFTPFTAILNVTGQPAISLPLYQGDDGLPTAVQLVGPAAREEVILRLAAQLEQALPWADRRPPL